jgi:hypothetical protein
MSEDLSGRTQTDAVIVHFSLTAYATSDMEWNGCFTRGSLSGVCSPNRSKHHELFLSGINFR